MLECPIASSFQLRSHQIGNLIAGSQAFHPAVRYLSIQALIVLRYLSSMADLPPLNTETIWAIINDSIDDATVNRLVWNCLGYRYDKTSGSWDATEVAPDWRDKYPEPPDFTDSRPATIQLTRSIPPAYKQLLKVKLEDFKGYKVNELNPRRTRRATAANWLLSYIQSAGSPDQNPE